VACSTPVDGGTRGFRNPCSSTSSLRLGTSITPGRVTECAVKGAGPQGSNPLRNWFAPTGSNQSSRGNETAEASGRQIRTSGSMSGCGNGSMVELVRHRPTKGSATDRPNLTHRATSRLYHLDSTRLEIKWSTKVPKLNSRSAGPSLAPGPFGGSG
jgi:hypothetical protein